MQFILSSQINFPDMLDVFSYLLKKSPFVGYRQCQACVKAVKREVGRQWILAVHKILSQTLKVQSVHQGLLYWITAITEPSCRAITGKMFAHIEHICANYTRYYLEDS